MTGRRAKILPYLAQHHYLEAAQLSHLLQISSSITAQTIILADHTKIGKVNIVCSNIIEGRAEPKTTQN
jgi:DeoR/GlpR family transcriptional regulator of sugar metabolism